MRVISGRFKGRRLKSFQAQHIRPTTDRVKETIFNKLMGHWEGARVLDLFSGTGNLAIEACSRGAGHVEAVESHRLSLKIMRENFSSLGLEGEIKTHARDVFQFLKSYQGEAFDIVLVDPPFTESLAHAAMEALSQARVAGLGTLVVIEASGTERLDDSYPGFNRLDTRDFGDKRVAFFQKAED